MVHTSKHTYMINYSIWMYVTLQYLTQIHFRDGEVEVFNLCLLRWRHDIVSFELESKHFHGISSFSKLKRILLGYKIYRILRETLVTIGSYGSSLLSKFSRYLQQAPNFLAVWSILDPMDSPQFPIKIACHFEVYRIFSHSQYYHIKLVLYFINSHEIPMKSLSTPVLSPLYSHQTRINSKLYHHWTSILAFANKSNP